MDNLFVETRPIGPAYWRILTTWSDDAVTRSGLMDLWWAKQTFRSCWVSCAMPASCRAGRGRQGPSGPPVAGCPSQPQ